ncbi:MAG: 3'-5' exoribonuclease, partial [Candidatus Sungbacteria bacterium]|nr:3'-5' exoribonuclease [Candidatus Sungbacteria bacterium]
MAIVLPSEDESYISVDIEASGNILAGTYSMLSIGACVVGGRSKKFYVELKPLNGNYTPEALEKCGLDMERLLEEGIFPKKAMEQFEAWIKKVSGGKTPVMVAFNAPFDWMFVNWYFYYFLKRNPFANSCLDMKAYYMGMMNTSWEATRSSRIPQEFHSDLPHTHNALDDALEQAEMCEKFF